MKRKIRFIILSFLIILVLSNSNIIIESVNQSFNIFYEKIFLSLFPFFILSDILINYNYPYYLGKIFGSLFNKVFKISNESVFVIFLSILTGHPTNAFYLKNLLDDNIISLKEAQNVLIYTYFPSPMFIIGTIGFTLYNDIKIGFIILCILYLTNFIMALFLNNKNYIYNKSNIIIKKSKPLIETIKLSLFNSLKSLVIILGNITIFVIIINLINKYFAFSPIISSIITSILEITNGNILISNLNINLNEKLALSVFSLIFGGFCIHTQVMSILSNYKINYKKLLIIRLFSSLIVSFICYLIF